MHSLPLASATCSQSLRVPPVSQITKPFHIVSQFLTFLAPPTEWMDNDTILGAISPFHVDSDPFSLADLSDEPGPTLTMNRVRRASVRLNEAYNMSHPEPKVTVCPIHGEGCDGETVTEPHLTEQMHRARKQFVELVPLVKGEDGIRGMIDWEGLLKQEQGRM